MAVLTLVALAAGCGSDETSTATTTTRGAVTIPASSRASTATATSTTATGSASAGATTTSAGTGRSSYAAAPCPNPIVPGVPQIDLGPQFECGYLTVPENRSQAASRTIRIAVARIKATGPNPKPDPLVYLAGGPGGTGLASAVQRVAAGWNADRDVIFIDQRGTLKADPLLACPEVDAFTVAAFDRVATDPATGEASAAAAKACRDRLAAAGVDLAAYNTHENAADVADLRLALGIDEWNLYGVSYGTDLALQTVRDHPEGIRSLVLDSLVPPQQNLMDGFWPNAAEGYRALFEACAADAACHTAFPNVESEFMTLVQELDAKPRTITVEDPALMQPRSVVIDGFTLANLVVVASLSPGAIEELPAMIHDLATGTGAKAATALLATAPPPGLTGYGLAYGVFCGEQISYTTPEQSLAEAKRALPAFPDGVLSLLPQAPHLFGDCAAWNVPKRPAVVHEAARTDVPVLLLDGSLDAITPPSWATLAASTLPSSHVVVIPGAGHDVMIWRTECAVAVMRSFLDDPDDVDQSCVSQLAPFTFATS